MVVSGQYAAQWLPLVRGPLAGAAPALSGHLPVRAVTAAATAYGVLGQLQVAVASDSSTYKVS